MIGARVVMTILLFVVSSVSYADLLDLGNEATIREALLGDWIVRSSILTLWEDPEESTFVEVSRSVRILEGARLTFQPGGIIMDREGSAIGSWALTRADGVYHLAIDWGGNVGIVNNVVAQLGFTSMKLLSKRHNGSTHIQNWSRPWSRDYWPSPGTTDDELSTFIAATWEFRGLVQVVLSGNEYDIEAPDPRFPVLISFAEDGSVVRGGEVVGSWEADALRIRWSSHEVDFESLVLPVNESLVILRSTHAPSESGLAEATEILVLLSRVR